MHVALAPSISPNVPGTRWLITRHPGALAWMRQQGIDAQWVTHLNPEDIAAGDEVYGTLPLHLAAEVCARGARFFALSMRVPLHLRGREIEIDTMLDLGATLEEFQVRSLIKE